MLQRRPGGRGGPSGRTRVIVPQPMFNKGWERVICVASGPSLTAEQGFRISAAAGWKVIAVNTSWQRVPMADVLYACDQNWWKMYHLQVQDRFHGECWTADRWSAHKYGLNFVQTYDRPGLSREIGVIHSGANGGYQAVNLAYLFGARRIVLVGYDMMMTYGLSHWHGEHPEGLGTLPAAGYKTFAASGAGDGRFVDWIDRFRDLAYDLREDGVRVANASIETALPWFRRAPLESALCP